MREDQCAVSRELRFDLTISVFYKDKFAHAFMTEADGFVGLWIVVKRRGVVKGCQEDEG